MGAGCYGREDTVEPRALDLILIGILLAAAARDATTRRLPHALAAASALTCALHALACGGAARLYAHLTFAAALSCALVAFEVRWRQAMGAPGIGMGDIKLLFALVLRDPAGALASFAAGLLGLALCACAKGRASMPLIPFLAAAQIPLILASW